MGIFSQSKDIQVQGTRNPYPRSGFYLVELNRHSFNPSSRKDKQPLAIVEYKILDVLEDFAGSAQPAGTHVSWFSKLEVDRTGELTDIGKLNMARLKSYVRELLGGDNAGVSENDVTPEAIASAFGQAVDDGKESAIEGWDGTEVSGLQLTLRVVEGTSDRGAKYTNMYFKALDNE